MRADGDSPLRSTAEIFDKSESIRPEPLPESDSPSESAAPDKQEASSEPSEKPAPAKAKPAAAAKPAPKGAPAEAAAHDEAEDEDPEPVDVEGYKLALKKARGDGRKFRSAEAKFRKQWEETERERARMEGELRAYRAQQAQRASAQTQDPAPQEPGFWDGDPEAYIKRTIEAERAAFARHAELVADERAIRRVHQDADAAFKAFAQAKDRDPSLVQAAMATNDPMGFAYEKGKEILSASPEALYEKYGATTPEELEARIREQVLAGDEAPAPAPSAARPPIPPKSNATARGSGNGVSRGSE